MTDIYFSDIFQIDPRTLRDYGALDVCLVSDLPLFIDPFLLFSSEKKEYQDLHNSIINYIKYLRDHSSERVNGATLKELYCFSEVRQNWLGFTVLGNNGSGLGMDFAKSLNDALNTTLTNFGEENITNAPHLEKLALIKPGIGRDCISDFTTNLIKDYLLNYTQTFAKKYLAPSQCGIFGVEKAVFSYELKTWISKKYYLPKFKNDFVLLTPLDMLTKDDTWINRSDLSSKLFGLPNAVDDDILRERLNRYLGEAVREFGGKKPTKGQRDILLSDIMNRFPQLVDYYIKEREQTGSQASIISEARVRATQDLMISSVKRFANDLSHFYCNYLPNGMTSLEEARKMVEVFKDYIENNDGYRLINGENRLCSEKEVQLFFGLLLTQCQCDANREVNNGRGPVDFKLSNSSIDKTLIEFKLASNPALKKNLSNQVEVYKKANRTRNALKVIIFYTAEEFDKVQKILKEANLIHDDSIVLIDARSDNKPSASKA